MSVNNREDGLQICKKHQRKLVIPINLPSDCFGDLEKCFLNRKKNPDGVVSLQGNSTEQFCQEKEWDQNIVQ